MRGYRLVARHHGESFDPARAAVLEVEWWRVHRAHQHQRADRRQLVDALVALLLRIRGAGGGRARSRRAARFAMDHSDRWVKEGCDPESPLMAAERAALVRSYAGLLAAVHLP